MKETVRLPFPVHRRVDRVVLPPRLHEPDLEVHDRTVEESLEVRQPGHEQGWQESR